MSLVSLCATFHSDWLRALVNSQCTAYNNYCRPELTDGEENGLGIKLEQARHPCVELQDNVEYIPNDVQLIYGESSFMILTGPNVSLLTNRCRRWNSTRLILVLFTDGGKIDLHSSAWGLHFAGADWVLCTS